MSKKEIRTYCNYRDSGLKIENEPEEGEIVDEYDLIVSSDEELSMRQRIRELEAENEEIEQIAVISRSYADKIHPFPNYLENNRAAQVPTDVSSISSTEFVTPKKRKREKSRAHKRRHCHHLHQRQYHHHQHVRHVQQQQQQKLPLKLRSKKTHCKRRQKLLGKHSKKLHSNQYICKEIKAEAVSIESLESSDASSSLTDTDIYSKHNLSLNRKDNLHDDETYITRDTLRLAVARNSNDSKPKPEKLCLKDKLLKQENVATYNTTVTRRNNVDQENYDDDDDDDVQVIETEPYIQNVDDDSTDSMEEKELRLIALKSAVLKKHMARKMRNAESAYSPTDFDDMLSSGLLQQDQKLEDLDIVDLEEDDDSQNSCVIVSPEASPQLKMLDEQEESQQMVDCKPVDMDIAHSDSEDTTLGSWPKEMKTTLPSYSITPQDLANHFQYNFFMPDFREMPSKPPPPPGVDDYEHVPPPPPYHYFYNSEMQDMELENEELDEVHQFSECNSNYFSERAKAKELPSYKIDDVCNKEETADEEEEQALRALLLSKFQSPKNQKKSKKIASSEEDRSTYKELETKENSDNNIRKTKPTEFILKEAVKRLKIHSQTDNLKEVESVANINNNNQDNAYKKTIESTDNESESSNLLATLRNRLLKCKDQHKTNDHEKKVEKVAEILKQERENFEYKSNNLEYAKECESIFPSNKEVANTVDISDITRRLQKIKEDVLNATNKQLLSVHMANIDETLRNEDKPKVFVETLGGNTCRLDEKNSQLDNTHKPNQPFQNNIASSTKDFKNGIVREKTVEANFDTTTKQTTLKVTIKNDDHLKSENKEPIFKNNQIPLEENSVNNVSKSKMLKSNTNTKSKTRVIVDRAAVNKNKSAEGRTASKTQCTSLIKSSLIKPVAVRASEVPVATKFTARSTKIIKPNKIINTNVDFKRRELTQSNETSKALLKAPQQDQNSKSTNSIDNTRLITSVDQVKHMYKIAPFIINVHNSSNESTDDECGDCDTLYKPLYDYNDNASPLSLNLESPSSTPMRSNSPTDLNFNIQNSTDMEKKPAQKLDTENSSLSTSAIKAEDLNRVEKTNKTPLAVRHLPAAAQSEYRRLVHRMMLLENKRKSTIVDESKQADKELEDGHKTDADSTSKTSLVKKVLIRNANNNKPFTSLPESKGSTELVKVHTSNVLRSYENLYVKIGAGIVNNLDKSLKLVEEAKRAKISKLKIENRIRELKSEMEALQSQHKEEQQKISRIYPTICTTNEVISSLKQKRTKIFKAAINLGKTIKGEDYRLSNDLKERINLKSKQLATEIKMVNSLKIQDLSNIEITPKPNVIKELGDNKNNVEDSKHKSISENNEKFSIPEPRTTNESIFYGKDEKENKENSEESKSNIHLSHTSTDIHVGGNTEFQNKGPYIPNENMIQSGNRCPLEKHDDSGDSDSDQKTSLTSYISPLEHLRNIDSNMDPNGVICPYDLMGHCEDVTCKYVHISPEAKS